MAGCLSKNAPKSTSQYICAGKSLLLTFQHFCHYTLTFRNLSPVFVPLFQYPDPPHISVSDGKVRFLALSISDFSEFLPRWVLRRSPSHGGSLIEKKRNFFFKKKDLFSPRVGAETIFGSWRKVKTNFRETISKFICRGVPEVRTA